MVESESRHFQCVTGKASARANISSTYNGGNSTSEQKDTYKAKKMSRLHRSCCTSLASAYQAGDLAAELWRFHGFSLHSDVHDHREVMSSKIKWAGTDITVGLASLGLESFSVETLPMSQRIYDSSRLIFSGVKRHAALLSDPWEWPLYDRTLILSTMIKDKSVLSCKNKQHPHPPIRSIILHGSNDIFEIFVQLIC